MDRWLNGEPILARRSGPIERAIEVGAGGGRRPGVSVAVSECGTCCVAEGLRSNQSIAPQTERRSQIGPDRRDRPRWEAVRSPRWLANRARPRRPSALKESTAALGPRRAIGIRSNIDLVSASGLANNLLRPTRSWSPVGTLELRGGGAGGGWRNGSGHTKGSVTRRGCPDSSRIRPAPAGPCPLTRDGRRLARPATMAAFT